MGNSFIVIITIVFAATISVSSCEVGYDKAKKLYETHPCKIIKEYRKDSNKYNEEYCIHYLKLEEMDINKE
jgi:hypothetical protein